jgi:hypothetical protein
VALQAVVPSLLVVAALFTTAALGETEKPRIDPWTLIGRHLAAIGTEKARKFRWRVIDGTCTKTGRFADVRGSVFASGGSFPCLLNFTSGYTTTRLTIVFESDIQPTDGWLWDGRDFKAVGAGATGFGDLSGFMYMAPEFVKQGVFGGVLSAAWPLLEAEEAASRMEIKGTKQEKGLVLQVVT